MKKSEEKQLQELLARQQMEKNDAHEAYMARITDGDGYIEWCRLSMLAKTSKFALEQYEERLEGIEAAKDAEWIEKSYQQEKRWKAAMAAMVEVIEMGKSRGY